MSKFAPKIRFCNRLRGSEPAEQRRAFWGGPGSRSIRSGRTGKSRRDQTPIETLRISESARMSIQFKLPYFSVRSFGQFQQNFRCFAIKTKDSDHFQSGVLKTNRHPESALRFGEDRECSRQTFTKSVFRRSQRKSILECWKAKMHPKWVMHFISVRKQLFLERKTTKI